MRRSSATVGSAVLFFAGPGTVTVLVSWLLTGCRWHEPVPHWWPARVLGGALIFAGAAVLVHAFIRFVHEGRGTPVPIAAPDQVVVGGLYRHVRNPMYVALFAVLVGEPLLLGGLRALLYPLLLGCFAAAYVRWREEPALVRRFGEDYERYRREVPAWIPRPRPWYP
ncbi:isoprenylcysteine carboxylmethyltransferase family protein [Saccharopolyspora sp. NPDC049357]|uniref:methyltransferase family protein n=1 Tax=Saccharopolyspora sp. NPDC049357 TaxID=3154507 RepID=UPI0034176647